MQGMMQLKPPKPYTVSPEALKAIEDLPPLRTTSTDGMRAKPQNMQSAIVPTGRNQSWLDARLALDREGKRMPTNVDYDKVLVGSEKWREIRNVFPAWTDSVLVYPAKNGEFNAGRDVVDAFKDGAGNEWVFSAASIPKEAIGRKGVGIHIDHPAIEVRGKTVILSAGPESTVTVLENFIQESGKTGKVDEKTRVPLAVSNVNNLPAEQMRRLWRIDGAGVRPLVRDLYGYGNRDRRLVGANGRQDIRFGVALVETENPKV